MQFAEFPRVNASQGGAPENGISGDVRTPSSPNFSFQGEEMALYVYCILYVYIYYIYMYIIYYIYIGFREGYIKSNISIIVQSNNFPQLSNIKLCVVRRNLDRWIFFIAAGARHGYATWRKVEGGDGAVTWLVLLNNTQLVGSWDMIPLMALVDGFLPNPLKNMLVKLEHFPGR